MGSKRTKHKRLIGLVEAYRKIDGKAECKDFLEVADWAIANGLHPVPGMLEPLEQHTRWDELFYRITGAV